MKQLTSIFLKGAATVLPVVLTLYFAWWLAVTVEGAMRPVLPDALYFPGLGWLFAIALMVGVGILMQLFLIERLYAWATEIVDRIPVVRSVFGMLQDLFALVNNRATDTVSTVVSVTFDNNVQLIGFVTNQNADELAPGFTGDDLVAVYLPMSYQIGGFTVMLPSSRLTPLKINAEEAMKLVLTAGLKANGREPTVDLPLPG